MVIGRTSFNQALCCGVSRPSAVEPLVAGESDPGSPLSSATTEVQTEANADPGSSVNDGSPGPGSGGEQQRGRQTVHMVIHRCGQDGRPRRSISAVGVVPVGNQADRLLIDVVWVLHWATIVGVAVLLIPCRLAGKRLWQKLTVFPRVPTVLQHWNGRNFRPSDVCVTGVTPVNRAPGSSAGWRGLTNASDVSTLEQSPECRRYGCDRIFRDCAGYERDQTYQRRSGSSGYACRHDHPDATA